MDSGGHHYLNLSEVQSRSELGMGLIDHIMVFQDHFQNHILADQIEVLSVAFEVPTLDKRWGGTGANIAFNLVKQLANGLSVGPMLLGMAQPAHVLNATVTVRGTVNMSALAVVDASETKRS